MPDYAGSPLVVFLCSCVAASRGSNHPDHDKATCRSWAGRPTIRCDDKPLGLRRERSPIRDRCVCRLLSIVHGQRQRLRRAAAIGPWHKQRRFGPSPRCQRRHHRRRALQRQWARGWRCNSAFDGRFPDAPRSRGERPPSGCRRSLQEWPRPPGRKRSGELQCAPFGDARRRLHPPFASGDSQKTNRKIGAACHAE